MEYQVGILETTLRFGHVSTRAAFTAGFTFSDIWLAAPPALSSPLRSLLFSRLCLHVRDAETDFSGLIEWAISHGSSRMCITFSRRLD